MTTYEGTFATPAGRFALVAARFNQFVVEHLIGGAVDALRRHGVADDAVDLVWVPGSFEVPLVAKRLDDREFENRLSHIATRWSVLLQAHQETDAAAAARQQLLERYCGAVYRYLLAAVRDHHAAEDLTQEFALRFVRGQFRLANPER